MQVWQERKREQQRWRRGKESDRDKGIERLWKLLVDLPLGFMWFIKHEPTKAWLVVDIEFAPPLHSLGLPRTFTSEIPMCYMLRSEPEVLRKEDEPTGWDVPGCSRKVGIHFLPLIF